MINKTKNQLLQITINKADYERLLKIQNDLSTLLNVDLNKSQTIAFLIKNYGKNTLNVVNDIFKSDAKKTEINGVNYGAQVKALKDKLNVSYTKLSEIIGIPAATLKKYAANVQKPSGDNLLYLQRALKDYGIK